MKTIGVFNPSSAVYDAVDLKKLEAFFENKGIRLIYSEHLWEKNRFLCGTDEQRASDIMSLFCNDDVDALMAFRGGCGSGRVLDLLDYDLIKKHKKTVIGFSDTTALQLALWAKTGIPCLSGFLPKFDVLKADKVNPLVEKSLDLALAGESLSASVTPMNGACKNIEGTLLCGTLVLIEQLLGTPYCPDFKDTILVIEDVTEEPYSIDVMLTHLRLAGVFEQVKGVIFGNFNKCISTDKNDGTLEEVLSDFAAHYNNLPCWQGLPYGHVPTHIILPIGSRAEIKDNTLCLSYDLKM